MNPGYAGRSELPDSLKRLFRSVAMFSPNRRLIGQVMLFAQGFKSAEMLSDKVVPLFELCKEQLSPQVHYDFGLRALKSVLLNAGLLKRRLVAQHGKPAENESWEQGVLIRSINETVIPKLVREDVEPFKGLMEDMFPDSSARTLDQYELKTHILEVCSEKGLVATNNWLDKVQQIFDVQVPHCGMALTILAIAPWCYVGRSYWIRKDHRPRSPSWRYGSLLQEAN